MDPSSRWQCSPCCMLTLLILRQLYTVWHVSLESWILKPEIFHVLPSPIALTQSQSPSDQFWEHLLYLLMWNLVLESQKEEGRDLPRLLPVSAFCSQFSLHQFSQVSRLGPLVALSFWYVPSCCSNIV